MKHTQLISIIAFIVAIITPFAVIISLFFLDDVFELMFAIQYLWILLPFSIIPLSTLVFILPLPFNIIEYVIDFDGYKNDKD